jgi:hypothetical protein
MGRSSSDSSVCYYRGGNAQVLAFAELLNMIEGLK